MPSVPPPNAAIAELADVLGQDNARILVRTFLRDFPTSIEGLKGGDRRTRHRLAHSMKSNSRLVGATLMSQRMLALELRLDDPAGQDVTAADIAAIKAEYVLISGPLEAFAEVM